jgi:two-component system, NarL family, nitrate/nitrite response regulator NarL
MAGEYWIARENISDLVHVLRASQKRAPKEKKQRNRRLTARELEVVSAVVAGYTNKDIAQKFSLSEDTVKHHLTNIFDKLGVSNRLELAILAISRGIVSNP